MHVYHSLREVPGSSSESSVAIGNFDGVHLGHLKLLGKMVETAKRLQASPTVMTFFPHPVEVLNPSIRVERLCTATEKLEKLKALGVEQVLVEPFSHELAGLSPKDFFQHYLVNGLKARSVHVGANFRFGKSREGNTELLRELTAAEGIELHVLDSVEERDQRISSTIIRNKIREGDVRGASEFLGYCYRVSGIVQRGEGLGQKLGFATANLSPPNGKILPAVGVYAVRCRVQTRWYDGVANLGVRPTVAQKAPLLLEAHLFGINQELYGLEVEVEFVDRLRGEEKFDSVEALKAQISDDVLRAREILNP